MNGDVNYVKSSPAFEIRLPTRRTLVGLKRLRTTYTTGCPKVSVGTFTEDNSVIDRVNAKSFESPIAMIMTFCLMYKTSLQWVKYLGTGGNNF